MTQKFDGSADTAPQQIAEDALDLAKGGLSMVGMVDPNQMHDLMQPTPTIHDLDPDVLYGGKGHDHMEWQD